MSQENVEVARRIFPGGLDMVALFGKADLLAATRQTIEPLVHPAFETAGDPNYIAMGPDTGVERGGPRGLLARGVDGFMAFWQDWLTAFEVWHIGQSDFREVDADRVLATYEVRARSKTAQVDMGFNAAHLMTFRDGKLARVELFLNHTDALKAAGLDEK
jgi:ketosteroid isomerase-like protein